MLHGPQRGMFELEFRLPSECADALASGAADIGIVPSFELTRQKLEILPGAGIACHGPVRSILLISAKPPDEVRTLAADSSSRTSVELARIVLDHKYGARPEVLPHAPDLDAMLGAADAALIIGDPALRIDPAHLPYQVRDLGADWVEMTGYPMVFAVWAARKGVASPLLAQAFRDSCRFGLEHMEEIVEAEGVRRGFAGTGAAVSHPAHRPSARPARLPGHAAVSRVYRRQDFGRSHGARIHRVKQRWP